MLGILGDIVESIGDAVSELVSGPIDKYRDNLDIIDSMWPLTAREEELALMQFEYTNSDIAKNFPDHPVVKKWQEKGLI